MLKAKRGLDAPDGPLNYNQCTRYVSRTKEALPRLTVPCTKNSIYVKALTRLTATYTSIYFKARRGLDASKNAVIQAYFLSRGVMVHLVFLLLCGLVLASVGWREMVRACDR